MSASVTVRPWEMTCSLVTGEIGSAIGVLSLHENPLGRRDEPDAITAPRLVRVGHYAVATALGGRGHPRDTPHNVAAVRRGLEGDGVEAEEGDELLGDVSGRAVQQQSYAETEQVHVGNPQRSAGHLVQQGPHIIGEPDVCSHV